MSKFRRKNKGMSAGLRNNDASEKHLVHRFQTLKSTTLKMKSLAQELVRACHLRLVKVVEAFRILVEELMNVTLHAFESSLSFAPRALAPLACIFHSSPVLSIRMPATGTGLVGPLFYTFKLVFHWWRWWYSPLLHCNAFALLQQTWGDVNFEL